MAEPGETFTLYLRGDDGAAIRNVLKPFGNGGDLDRWRLDAWDAEVVLGKGAQVALIRVPYAVDAGSLRTLIRELHEAARDAGLVLSDDITSKKSPEALIQAFGLEGERASAQRAQPKSARWSLGKTIAFWVVGGAMMVLAWFALGFARDLAHRLLEGP